MTQQLDSMMATATPIATGKSDNLSIYIISSYVNMSLLSLMLFRFLRGFEMMVAGLLDFSKSEAVYAKAKISDISDIFRNALKTKRIGVAFACRLEGLVAGYKRRLFTSPSLFFGRLSNASNPENRWGSTLLG